jgi:hypothetical protein
MSFDLIGVALEVCSGHTQRGCIISLMAQGRDEDAHYR